MAQAPCWSCVQVISFALFCCSALAAKKPNIILLVADDLGYGDLGCFGNTTINTPNIDKLASEGVKLTHAIATASMCTPSRAAFLTGRHQMRTGMAPMGNMRVNLWLAVPFGLPSSEITIGELAKQAGYQNGFIGKWHMGVNNDKIGDHMYHPLNQGFDYYYGLLGTNFDDFGDDGHKVMTSSNPTFNWQMLTIWLVTASSIFCFYKTGHLSFTLAMVAIVMWAIPWLYLFFIFDNFILLNSMLHRNFEVVEQPVRLVGLSKRLVTEGTDFMSRAKETGGPFMLVMSWIHTHTALRVSKEFKGKSKFGIYGDAVEELDWSVGKVLQHLDDIGERENTLVMFISDHGGHIELGVLGGYNGVLRGGKTQGAPEGAIRVPGIIRWPEVVPAGVVVDEPVSLMDIYPLVASATGVALPTDRVIDGRDILPLIQGKQGISPHEFMFHYCGDKLHATRYRPRTGNSVWKLVTHVPRYLPGEDKCVFACSCNNAIRLDQPNLYDIQADPGERAPVDPQSETYTHVKSVIDKAVAEHRNSLPTVQRQYRLHNTLWRPSLQECCPGPFPFKCQCMDSKFSAEMYT